MNVQLHSGPLVPVPVFDTKEMIISLLMDSTLMTESNFAEGYNVLTGDVDMINPSNQKYGEVHTWEAWLPARNKYCGGNEGKTNMPVALVVFGDKSHTDLYGALLLTQIIFTMTLFNRSTCNDTKFWRPIDYIPNLLYGKGKADKTSMKDKIQDEHTCLSCLFQSLHRISKNGGYNLVVLSVEVHIQVWIHYFIGDTEDNNKWLGQYPGNREGVQQPYCKCKCSFEQLSNTNLTFEYITLNDIHEDKRCKRDDEDGGKH